MDESQHSRFQYSLRTLFELTTISAILLGIGVMLPWLGIMLAILVLPGFIRFCYCDVRTSVRGKPLAGKRRFRLMLIDLGIGAWISVASCAMGFAAYAQYGGAFGVDGALAFILSILAALVGGIPTFSYLSWYFWFRSPEELFEPEETAATGSEPHSVDKCELPRNYSGRTLGK